jgi:hypothetical protein
MSEPIVYEKISKIKVKKTGSLGLGEPELSPVHGWVLELVGLNTSVRANLGWKQHPASTRNDMGTLRSVFFGSTQMPRHRMMTTVTIERDWTIMKNVRVRLHLVKHVFQQTFPIIHDTPHFERRLKSRPKEHLPHRNNTPIFA